MHPLTCLAAGILGPSMLACCCTWRIFARMCDTLCPCRVPVPFPDSSSFLHLHEYSFAPQKFSSAAPQSTSVHNNRELSAQIPETVSTHGTENLQTSSTLGPARLLSLPSFAKVVYDAAAGTDTASGSTAAQSVFSSSSRQLSQQSSAGSKASQSMTAPASHPLLLQRSSSLQIPTLEFDSHFESGNLQKAVQVGTARQLQLVTATAHATKCR